MRHRLRTAGRSSFILGLALGFLVGAAPIMCSSQEAAVGNDASSHQGPANVRKTAPAAAQGRPVPFRVKETLNYRVAWSAFSDAASVRLTVPERRDLFGWQTWHFRAVVHTLSPVRTLFAIDDQFDSYTDTMTLASHQFESHLNELGRADDQVLRFVPEGQIPRGPGPIVVVSPGTRDPLNVLYTLRTVDWQRTPIFRAPVYDGKNFYRMEARREASNQTVTVAAGRFSTSRISIRLFQYRKEVVGTHFVLWISNDAAHVPAILEADLPFGSIRAELTSFSR